MPADSAPRLLILETSSRVGRVAVAEGAELRGERSLEEPRRHARDLAPAVRDLLVEQGWRPRDLRAVLVGRGPGSYTGLRVGIMSAKALAYATGCALLAIDSFAAIAHQAPAEATSVDVIADAQQDRVYVQKYSRSSDSAMAPASALIIQGFGEWADALVRSSPEAWVSGPGLRGHEGRLPASCRIVPASRWDPLPGSVLNLGLARLLRGERDDPWAAEPLYLRPSSAELQWDARGR